MPIILKMADEVTLFDLPREDITFCFILPRLSLKQLFRCRQTCHAFKELCDGYFRCCTSLDCSTVSKRLTTAAFEFMTRENTHLRCLVLRNCTHWLHEYIVVDVLRENRQLKKLDLSGCPKLTNVTLFKLTQYCPNLIELHLKECIWVSPDACLKISLSCKDIEYLDLSDCPRVDDECVCILSVNLKKLGTLLLNGCLKVSDVCSAVIAMKGKKLRHLGLKDCPNITETAFEWLEYCKSLEYLEVQGCNVKDAANSLKRLQDQGIMIDTHVEQSSENICVC